MTVADPSSSTSGWSRAMTDAERGRLEPPGRLPWWLRELDAAYRPGRADASGFRDLLTPLADRAIERLTGAVERLPGAGLLDVPSVVDSLGAHLAERFRTMAERTLVLELHARRMEGTLDGETSEERFAAFVEAVHDRESALGILRTYPVLARDAAEHAERWRVASLELLERFVADRDALVAAFGPESAADSAADSGPDPGPLVAVAPGLGDPHDHGRTVAVLTFASGFRAVYKPRSLAMEAELTRLLEWLNRRGDHPPLRPLRVLERPGYGWTEHLEPEPVEDAAGAGRFYERQGAYAALLYALDASDMHYQNLIAVGEQPVLVDVETLFQPRFTGSTPAGPVSGPLGETVLASGLLPRGRWDGGAGGTLDLSGIGASSAQRVEVRRLEGWGTDRLRYVPDRAPFPAAGNRPRLDGHELSPWPFRDRIERGFRGMAALLERERETLLAPDGPLAAFAGLESRAILRGTTVYVHLLQAAFHPDHLQDLEARDRLLDGLRLDAERYPWLARVLPAETRSLARGDVPRFRARPGSRDLWTPEGERLADLFPASGLARVRQRLERLGREEVERQAWILRAGLESFRPESERVLWEKRELPAAAGGEAGVAPAELVRVARTIGERLELLVVRYGEDVAWLDQVSLGPGAHGVQAVGVDLYHGLLGIALFLSELGAELETGPAGPGDRFTALARAALRTARRRIGHNDRAVQGAGAFAGWGGVVYGLTRLGELWSDDGLLDEAERLGLAAADRVGEDRHFDLTGGAAGLLAGLLALHDARPSRRLLDACRRCAQHLLEHAVEDERGLAWPPPPGVDALPLTGFGHGAAGVALALARLGAAAGEPVYEEAARRALDYERSWFDPERDNWPDLRVDRAVDGRPGAVHAWCHGAPGIGLGRTALLGCLDDPELEGEIRVAVRSTLRDGFGQSHCLCHGDLGNLDLLLTAAARLGDDAVARRARELTARILMDLERSGSRCGAAAGREIPGLMTGLAGIGHGLLRAAAPERVPSVLLLETAGLSGAR